MSRAHGLQVKGPLILRQRGKQLLSFSADGLGRQLDVPPAHLAASQGAAVGLLRQGTAGKEPRGRMVLFSDGAVVGVGLWLVLGVQVCQFEGGMVEPVVGQC